MNLARAESSPIDSSGKLSLSSLPAATVQKAAARLCWVAWACAATAVAMALLQNILQPEVARIQTHLPIQINTVVVILSSLGLATAGSMGWLSPIAVLRLGLVLEVFVGFALGTFEYTIPWDPAQPVRGISWMALWIVLCGLLIPNRPRTMAFATIATASTGPLAYLFFHVTPIPVNRLLIWNFPNFVVGLATVRISRRLYHLEVEVARAKELGSYRLESLIGKGGMGEVWRARHRLLARDAAVKLIRPEMLAGSRGKDAQVLQERFKQEAAVTAALRSSHTVELYDFGIASDGTFYYVMELLEGLDLETLVKRFGPQPPGRVVQLLTQVCQSLAEAHRAGLVHRDIKPTNIFVCRMGVEYDVAKVLDFGLVKSTLGPDDARVSGAGVTGTPAYMAPEIALGQETIDGRADLYGLGCVAYWLISGSLVFEANNPTAMALAHVQRAPVPLSQRKAAISASLDQIVSACLAKNPDERPANAETLARSLLACVETGQWTSSDAETWWSQNAIEGKLAPAAPDDASRSTTSLPTL
jgi:eukaryotic-like serine/threonine-protein kinase